MRPSEPKARHVRAKELESLLRTPGCVRDVELEAVANVGPCYALPDGAVLVTVHGIAGGRLHQSRSELLKELADIASQSPRHVLAGRPCTRPSFTGDIDVWVSRLRDQLALSADQLDGSLESLKAVDRALSERSAKGCFDALVAYVGEVIRGRTGGRWVSELTDGETYEPMIRTPERVYQPALLVHAEIMRRREGRSLHDATRVALWRERHDD